MLSSRGLRLLVSALWVSLVAALPAYGAQVTANWVSPVSGNWNSAAAWSSNPVFPNNSPTTSFLANINASGAAYTVSFNSGTVVVDNLQLNSASATIDHAAGFLQIGSGTLSSGTYTLGGGSLGNTGMLGVSNTFNFNAGAISGIGTTTVNAGGVLNVGTAGTRFISQALINSGTVNFLNNASLLLTNGTISNQGVMNFANSNGAFTTGGASIGLVNSGTWNINATGLFSLGTVNYINSGTINVNSGTLTYNTGTHTHLAGTRITGAGTFLSNNGNFLFDGASTISIARTVFNNGMIYGTGALTLESTFDWNGGSMSGAGTTTVASSGVLNIGTLGARTLARSLVNHGTMNFVNNGTLTLASGTLSNFGVMNFGSGGGAFLSGGPSIGLVNSGTWNFSPTGTFNAGSIFYINNGTINVSTGTLAYTFGTFTHNAGTRFTGAGTLLNNGANFLFDGASTISIARTVFNNGSIYGSGALSLESTFDWNGGSMSGTGTTTVAASGVLNIGSVGVKTLSRVLVNNGTMNFANNASLALSNGTLGNFGVMNFGTAGTAFQSGGGSFGLSNAGTWNIAAGAGSFNFGSINYINSATINVNSGTLTYNFGTYTHLAGTRFSGAGTLLNNGGSLLFDGASTLSIARTLFNSGSIFGSGALSLESTFDWNGGSMSGLGTSTVASTGVLNIGTLGVRTLSRVLVNSGTVNFPNNTALTLAGGTVSNFGVMNFADGNGAFGGGAGTNALSNAGTWNITATGTFSLGTINYINSGTINVNTGTLAYSFGTYTHNAGTRFTGGGTLQNNGANLVFNGASTLSIGHTVFNSGSIVGNGAVLMDTIFDWNGGLMVGGGTTTIASTGALNIDTPSTNLLSRTLINNGLTNFVGGASLSMTNGKFVNGATGTLSLPSNPNFVGLGGNNLLQNDGTIYVATGAVTITVPFLNDGTIIIGSPPPGGTPFTSAQLTVNNPLNLSTNTLTKGTWRIDDGAELILPGSILTNAANIILSGPTASFPALSSLTTNNGTIELAAGQMFSTAGNVTNNGFINIGSFSTLSINGNLLGDGDMQLNGTLAVTGEATFGNLGGAGSLIIATEKTFTAKRVRLPRVDIGNNGNLILNGNGGPEGVSVIADLNLAGTPAAPASGLDLQRNDLIVTLGASGTQDDLRQLIKSGYNNNTWTGQGIRSSTAVADGKALGYATAAALYSALPDDWQGQAVGSSSLIISYTFAGDANLDHRVNTVDFNQLAGSFGTSGRFWYDGDFNYSGTVDSVDFDLLVANYGRSAQAAATPSASPTLGAIVPEPSGLLAALAAAISLSLRGRRCGCASGK